MSAEGRPAGRPGRGIVVAMTQARPGAMDEAEIEAAVAAVVRGEQKIGGGYSDQGWVISRVGTVLWYLSWSSREEGPGDGESREASEDEVRRALRSYGRKILRKC